MVNSIKFSDYLSEQKFKLVELNDDDTEESSEKEADDKDSHKSDHDEHHDKHHDKHHHDHDKDEDEDGEEEKDEDHDHEGVIRTIKNAHLIYKRQDTDGTYSELWMYDIGKGPRDEYHIRTAILDGTDIDQKTGSSEDGNQHYVLWTCNNRQLMQITGLAN
jgi:hypothetical protein